MAVYKKVVDKPIPAVFREGLLRVQGQSGSDIDSFQIERNSFCEYILTSKQLCSVAAYLG